MDLIGKIFIVVILIMSIVFMALSLMVYATHRNWRDLVERPQNEVTPGKKLGLKYALANQEKTNASLRQEMESLRRTLQLERAARQQALAVLETKANQQSLELTAKNDTLATLRRQHDQAVTTMELAQTNLSELTKAVEGLKELVRRTQADRDDQFGKVVAMRDRLSQLEGAERRLEERNQQLTKEVAESARVLERYGLDRHAPLHGVPPKLDGEIKMVRDTDLVELSLGSDDGLRVGHKLDVYRSGGAYLGRVEVMYTDPDDSVARIIPEFRQGIIRRGDLVATRLLDELRTTARVN